nr:protein SHORT HYPOCOTYL IN WHITE LIGHT 1-like [Ipomoea batatas]
MILDIGVNVAQNVFRKISRKARKAVRSVLPVAISSQLVGFSVNGVIILTFLWVLKALLEVIIPFLSGVILIFLALDFQQSFNSVMTGINPQLHCAQCSYYLPFAFKAL